ncbi:matrin 3-like 1.2 isoform X2 [Vanacampus margaritifer]
MDGAPKGFAAGRGHLAAGSLNFSMNEQRSVRQMRGGVSGVGGGADNQESGPHMPRGGGGGGHLGGTMKLFASLGLSPADLDVLAQIPEEDINVDTLPQILLQLKNRKTGRGPASSGWDDGGRMGGASFAQGSDPSDFGFASVSRRAGLNFGGGGRERLYTELSPRDSYGGPQGALLSQPTFSQRRKGSPSMGKVQDFLGAPPPRFPHVCSLCDFDVHSSMEWSQHTNGLRHAENRRVLVNMYPEWDVGGAPGRSGIMESTNLAAGLLGPVPSGMPSTWGSGAGLGLGMARQNRSEPNVLRSQVVVVKYDRKPLSNKTLFSFAKRFGRLQEHLVLKTKAFLEMETHEEAVDMVNYYQQNPATLYAKPITFYLSRRLVVIQKEERSSDRTSWEAPRRDSQVIFFSNLPRQEDKKKELLTAAARFGVVEKYLFLTDQAFIQLGSPEDAEMMVKYYMQNPLTIKGRAVRLNICTKYKTLNINRRQKEGVGTRRRSSRSRSRSPSRSRDDNADKSASDDDDNNDDEVAGVLEGEGDERQSATGADEEEQPHQVAAEEEKPEGAEDGLENQAADGEKDSDVNDDVTEHAPVDAERGDESQEQRSEAEGGGKQPTEEDEDFLENMEDFVTLDELPDEDEKEAAAAEGQSDGIDPSRKGGLRVVNILGFRRGYKFLDELLGLATPFGKVVKHLVLDWRPEAFLQFSTEEEALAMVKFYNGNVMPSVCGRPVRVNHSLTYPTIQVRAALSAHGEPSGRRSSERFLELQCGASRVVYVGQLPNGKYENEDVLKLAEPFGKVKKCFLNPIKRECFLEMENAEAADQMAQTYKTNPAKLQGRRLLIYVSRKYTQLKYGHSCASATKRRSSSSSPKPSKSSEEPPAKKIKEKDEHKAEVEKPEEEEPQEVVKPQEEKEEEEEQKPQVPQVQVQPEEDLQKEQKKPGEEEEEQMEPQEENAPSTHLEMEVDTPQRIPHGQELKEEEEEPAADHNEASAPLPNESKSAAASLPLPPFDPDSAIGVEHIKMGYYCRVCLLFYSNEDMAKKTHCSSQAHYDKLQKYLEKEQSKAEKKRAKKTNV